MLKIAISVLISLLVYVKPQPNDKPNILLIVADDMNRLVGHLGPELGLEEWVLPTPNIDDMASKGVTFTNAHVCAPECKPSRTCLLYGQSPVANQVISNEADSGNPAIIDKEHMVAFMKRHGYATVNYQRLFHQTTANFDDGFDVSVFKGGNGPYIPRTGDDRLGDLRLSNNVDLATIDAPKEHHPDWETTDLMIEDMEANRLAGKKGFYAMGFTACHTPTYIPKEIMADIDVEPPRPPVPDNDFDDIPRAGSILGGSSKYNAELLLADRQLYTSFLRHYYGCIRLVDELVGKLMKYVEESDEEFVVMFTSDHGFHLTDKLRLSKFTLWSQVTQVPLVAYGGPFTGGKVIDTPVSLVDIYKTFSVLVGGKPLTHKLVGQDLAKVAAGRPRYAVLTYHKWGKAVITDRWHLITYQRYSYTTYSYGAQNQVDYELYRRSDPWQLENVASKFPTVVNRLKAWEM